MKSSRSLSKLRSICLMNLFDSICFHSSNSSRRQLIEAKVEKTFCIQRNSKLIIARRGIFFPSRRFGRNSHQSHEKVFFLLTISRYQWSLAQMPIVNFTIITNLLVEVSEWKGEARKIPQQLNHGGAQWGKFPSVLRRFIKRLRFTLSN